MIKNPDELAKSAIKHALKSLRKRKLLEEAAHAPACIALSKPLLSQGSEWKEKAETLELELQQCYKAQARLSEQLVTEVAGARAVKIVLQEKDTEIIQLRKEATQERDKCSELEVIVREQAKSLELVLSENKVLTAKLEVLSVKAKKFEDENKMLIDRWMLEKMKEAERLNEANIMYEGMMDQLKDGSIELLARKQVDGVVRQFEAGSENFAKSTIPTSCKHKIHGHEGGCGSIMFEHNSSKLISGGQDGTVKIWDTNTGTLNETLYGCIGSVLDLTVSHDNKVIVAASSSNNLYVWDMGTGRIRHTLKGHTDKVCAVDMSKFSCILVVSAAYDRTIKVWDLEQGYCIVTIITYSICNSLCFSMDGETICSGHVDGNLRLWSAKSGKMLSQVAAHSHPITSICLSQSGNIVLTSGKENLHNLFDMRSLEVCGSLKANGKGIAPNWSRSCVSADENYIAAGSSDGSVHIWSRLRKEIVSTLREERAPILSCSWSGLGKPLASASKNGTICIWA
ncbi:hypothetical protein ACHQM5_010874 [Ranunculus cassubicifolius]